MTESLAGRLPGEHLVKICSLQRPEDGAAAAEVGADLVGLIFAPARRRVSVELAQHIVAAVRAPGPAGPRVVGVFVDSPAERLNAVALGLELDLVQLHGAEPPEDVAACARPVIKALRLRPGTDLDGARRLADSYMSAPVAPLALTIEAHVAGEPGGSGQVADWELAARLAEEYPVILAGGLHPDNVVAAIAAVRPLGVDVSSGVETDGAKDGAKIAVFVGNARLAFDAADERAALRAVLGAAHGVDER